LAEWVSSIVRSISYWVAQLQSRRFQEFLPKTRCDYGGKPERWPPSFIQTSRSYLERRPGAGFPCSFLNTSTEEHTPISLKLTGSLFNRRFNLDSRSRMCSTKLTRRGYCTVTSSQVT